MSDFIYSSNDLTEETVEELAGLIEDFDFRDRERLLDRCELPHTDENFRKIDRIVKDAVQQVRDLL